MMLSTEDKKNFLIKMIENLNTSNPKDKQMISNLYDANSMISVETKMLELLKDMVSYPSDTYAALVAKSKEANLGPEAWMDYLEKRETGVFEKIMNKIVSTYNEEISYNEIKKSSLLFKNEKMFKALLKEVTGVSPSKTRGAAGPGELLLSLLGGGKPKDKGDVSYKNKLLELKTNNAPMLTTGTFASKATHVNFKSICEKANVNYEDFSPSISNFYNDTNIISYLEKTGDFEGFMRVSGLYLNSLFENSNYKKYVDVALQHIKNGLQGGSFSSGTWHRAMVDLNINVFFRYYDTVDYLVVFNDEKEKIFTVKTGRSITQDENKNDVTNWNSPVGKYILTSRFSIHNGLISSDGGVANPLNKQTTKFVRGIGTPKRKSFNFNEILSPKKLFDNFIETSMSSQTGLSENYDNFFKGASGPINDEKKLVQFMYAYCSLGEKGAYSTYKDNGMHIKKVLNEIFELIKTDSSLNNKKKKVTKFYEVFTYDYNIQINKTSNVSLIHEYQREMFKILKSAIKHPELSKRIDTTTKMKIRSLATSYSASRTRNHPNMRNR